MLYFHCPISCQALEAKFEVERARLAEERDAGAAAEIGVKPG